MRKAGLLLVLALAPGVALAHTPQAAPQAPWRPEPAVLFPILLSGLLYLTGYLRLRVRSEGGREVLARRGLLFAAGLGVLAAAVLSPLHQLGARSFTAHMLEHELMMLAAAPLLVLSRPLAVMIWAFPAAGRRALGAFGRHGATQGSWRFLSDPVFATVLQAAALWIWHLPSLFDRALAHEGWHVAQHLAFLITALLFWSAMLGPRRSAWTSALCLFATSMISGALGAFMAISASPWYAPYAALGLAAFGLTPAEDQQLAGVLMWVPGGLVHAIAALAILAPHLSSGRLREAPHG